MGAVTREEYLETLESTGFRDLEVVQVVDYFAASPSEETKRTAAGFNAHAIVIAGRKPE